MTDSDRHSRRRSPTAPALGWRGGLRYLWTQLTSMRTALVLLFALALAAVPGSLIPQRTIAPIRVERLLRPSTRGSARSTTGSGCSTSTARRGSRRSTCCCSSRWSAASSRGSASTPGAPRPAAADAAQPVPAAGVRAADGRAGRRRRGARPGGRAAAAAALPGRRHATTRVAAERGYLREAGNLVFHFSLLFLLLGVALGGAVRLPRHQRGDRRPGLLQHPDPVRRLHRRGAVHRPRPAAVHPDGEGLRGEVRDRRRCSAGPRGCSAPTSR